MDNYCRANPTALIRHALVTIGVPFLWRGSPPLYTFGQEKDLLSAEYSKCIERSGGADPGMLDCIKAEADRQDKRLNDAYKKLMNELKSDRKRQLQQVQRMWIKYIEANCDFYLDPDGGTAARLAASECPVLAKAARAKELENFIQ